MKITATFKVAMLCALSDVQCKTSGLPCVHNLHAKYFFFGRAISKSNLRYGRAIDHYIGPMKRQFEEACLENSNVRGKDVEV